MNQREPEARETCAVTKMTVAEKIGKEWRTVFWAALFGALLAAPAAFVLGVGRGWFHAGQAREFALECERKGGFWYIPKNDVNPGRQRCLVFPADRK